MAVDYPRALAAYKMGAEGGNAHSQYQLGYMLSEENYGVDPLDYKQALVWYEGAAARGLSGASLSWRNGRKWQRARTELAPCLRALPASDTAMQPAGYPEHADS